MQRGGATTTSTLSEVISTLLSSAHRSLTDCTVPLHFQLPPMRYVRAIVGMERGLHLRGREEIR